MAHIFIYFNFYCLFSNTFRINAFVSLTACFSILLIYLFVNTHLCTNFFKGIVIIQGSLYRHC